MHTMVYGEHIQSPQVKLAEKLCSLLPNSLNAVYFVNSGAESIDAAMKLAKRATGRTEIISFKNAYHGSTHGPLSIMGSETYKQAFRPLLPDCRLLDYNQTEQLNEISTRTACVIIEPIQAEAGILIPDNEYLTLLRKKCNETGTLLIFDEIQTGLGRTGKWFGFQHSDVKPDILCLAKALGAGLPLGCLVGSGELLQLFTYTPVLGHINTFGGNPVCCAASLAAIEVIEDDNLINNACETSFIFQKNIHLKKSQYLRGTGLFLAIELGTNQQVLETILKLNHLGLLTDWFLFCDSAIRVCPPLAISAEQIKEAALLINEAIN